MGSNSSNEAATYDAKHESTIEEIARRIEARRDFIGVDWVEDDSSSGGDDEGDDGGDEPSRPVRILDYACGTGSMSRVSLLPGFFASAVACLFLVSFFLLSSSLFS